MVGLGEGVKELVGVLLIVGGKLGTGVSVDGTGMDRAVGCGLFAPQDETPSMRKAITRLKIFILERAFMGQVFASQFSGSANKKP